MIETEIHIDISKMRKYHDTVIEGFARFIADLGTEGRDDLRLRWSPDGPSSPGEAPAIDTGALDRSIYADLSKRKSYEVRVQARMPYAIALEYGTHKMAARPFMRPWMHTLTEDYLIRKYKRGGYMK